jgi:hypothetical protein
MVNRINMEYKIEVLSPNAKTTSIHPFAPGETLEEGDCVQITSDGWELASENNNTGGIVIRGNVDDQSVAKSGNPIVLLGEAIIRLSGDKCDDAGDLSVGDPVCMSADGIIFADTAITSVYAEGPPVVITTTGGDPVWGIVLEVGPDASYVVIDVK